MSTTHSEDSEDIHIHTMPLIRYDESHSHTKLVK